MPGRAVERVTARQFIEEYLPERVRMLLRVASAKTLVGITERSPVRTGNFVSNWNAATGGPSESYTDRLEGSPESFGYPPYHPQNRALGIELARASAASTLLRIKPFDRIHLTNMTPYGIKLEFLGGSAQAPQGFARITVEEVADWMNSAPWSAIERSS